MKLSRSFPSFQITLLSLYWALQNCSGAIFTTIVTNGPATNRVNLVLFAEGYTNGQLNQFLGDCTNAAQNFLGTQPYAEYSNYFNVFAIFTNSAHAGSTHLINGPYRNGYTYFNSIYDANSDYIITIPPNNLDSNKSHGQGKIDTLLKKFLPSVTHDLPALLVNDPTAGGSDNYGTTAISSIPNISYILVHESGHTLGKLGDEYTTANPGFPNIQQPNTTTNTAFAAIPWHAWIATNTPLPTPFTGDYAQTIGLFAGAHYHVTGWYRPYENCCMQSFGTGFCPICQEALVLAIYGKTRPIDSVLPAGNRLSITSTQDLTFKLNLLQPATHSLCIQWFTNRMAVVGATNPVFTVRPAGLGNGTKTLSATVWDPTDWVRNDPKHQLHQTNIWNLNIKLPTSTTKVITAPPNIKLSRPNGGFQLQLTGTASAAVVLETSTNLMQWIPLSTNNLTQGNLFFTNFTTENSRVRFFRAHTPP